MSLLIVLDNYDSFTYNLVQMFMPYGLNIQVHRSDKISIDQIESAHPAYLLISPGPKDPKHSGVSIQAIMTFYKRVPILGVCLGMQCINDAFGGCTERAPVPMHGKTSAIYHDGHGLFKGVPSPFKAARYHSLMIREGDMDNKIIMNAHCQDGVVMGLNHVAYPLYGVQFHPESFLTENGSQIIHNFLQSGPLKK